MNFFEIFGWFGAFLLAISSFPQLYTTWHTKDVHSLSLPMVMCWLFGDLFCMIFVLSGEKQIPLLANYLLNILICIIILLMYFKYRKN